MDESNKIDVSVLKDGEFTKPVYNYLKLLSFMEQNDLSVEDMKTAVKIFIATVD